MPPQPTMSPCPSPLQLSPSVCLRLLCLLLLLTDCSSSVSRDDPVLAEPLTQPNTTQANCFIDCDIGVNATDLDLKNNSKGKQEDHSPPDLSSSNNTFNDSITLPPNQQPASPDYQVPSPATVTQPADPLPFTTTGSPTQVAHTEPITISSTSTTTAHGKIVHTTTSPVTSKATTTATSTTTTTRTSTAEPTTKAAEQPATTAEATTTLTKANTGVTLPTTTGTNTSPPPPPSAAPPQPNTPSTGMPPVQTSLPRGPTTATVTSTSATADRDKPVSSGTRVAVVDAAGDALTSQLVDTASLLAVLLFGLLFFLVTVAVFVTQAYESYRRKDYTQVDYLINGMYSDSGV